MECMSVPVYCRWGIEHMNQLIAIFAALTDAWERDSVEAMGAPGMPGNPEKIVAVVRRIVILLEQVTDWEQEVLVYSEHPVFGSLAGKMSGMSRPFIDIVLGV